jgi:hypothetical protein
MDADQSAGPATRAEHPAPLPLRRNPGFRMLWIGQILSDTGADAAFTAFPLLVLALTGSPVRGGIVAIRGSARRDGDTIRPFFRCRGLVIGLCTPVAHELCRLAGREITLLMLTKWVALPSLQLALIHGAIMAPYVVSPGQE